MLSVNMCITADVQKCQISAHPVNHVWPTVFHSQPFNLFDVFVIFAVVIWILQLHTECMLCYCARSLCVCMLMCSLWYIHRYSDIVCWTSLVRYHYTLFTMSFVILWFQHSLLAPKCVIALSVVMWRSCSKFAFVENANFDFQNLLNVNANRGIWFISWNIMHWFQGQLNDCNAIS